MTGDPVEVWATYMRAEGRAKRTIQDRVTTMRRFERDSGTTVLDAATDQLAEWLGRDELGPLARSCYHSMFKAFYRWAATRGLRADSPVATIRPAKRPRTQPRPITVGQFGRLLGEAADDDSLTAMLLLGGLAGLRVHEVARFHSRQLDVEAGTLEVRGKGGTHAVLPAHPLIVAHAGRMPREFWFPSQRAAHLGARTVSERVSLHMIRNRVPGTPHCLRHFYGTELVTRGADLRVVQELMRHASLQTTAVYTQVADDRKRAAILTLSTV
ncbi:MULTISPECIES: tyrosine-type recombinase/integrase [Gordonia]|uniref:Tyrosine-type recombinase/integrase n=1 Tax=Gordonia amicalis TaxID=89053 RepID=A0AAE4R287_9ACTN|nr:MULTISPECIES: tyrosine-type recombinase/integrase [Gordonia]ATD69190.1 tyrosine recombinase [Gordonia sp. 1D]MCZ4654235.1 tyrosine-type recombinase/integrase [Gordonia amicalis]MDJ0452110.1 tyrosine-type recombinase/integrase [Gordonia amicalis]MDV6308181.1 tyrosine-type recombinase/integrase [Gordonia amicalis]MDV6312008.1 tyrosine-type recombinase/integrase [Gordonia amicalis]